DPSSTRPTSPSRVISPARPVLTITCANSVGSLSLPVTLSVYWNVWPRGAGGAPICPAVTCVLCCRSASIMSCGISPRACILFGSSQTRIEYWPAPNTTTFRGHAEAPHVSANVQHFLFVDIEVHVNRSSLDDGGELGGAIGPHQFAQRHQARCNDAVEGSLYLGVAEVERGLRGIDLRLLEPGPRRVAIGRGIVERLLRGDLAAREIGLPFVIRFRLLQCRLRA